MLSTPRIRVPHLPAEHKQLMENARLDFAGQEIGEIVYAENLNANAIVLKDRFS